MALQHSIVSLTGFSSASRVRFEIIVGATWSKVAFSAFRWFRNASSCARCKVVNSSIDESHRFVSLSKGIEVIDEVAFEGSIKGG